MSWSTKLFFHINKRLGKTRWLDITMRLITKYLVFFLALLSLSWASTVLAVIDPEGFVMYMKLMMTAGAFGFGTSWLIAALMPQQRPVREHPKVNQLITPLYTWKSFPSDHTVGSFIIALITCMMGAPVWFCIVLFVIAALVSVSRVYVGVHYPRDIIGGIIVAIICGSASPFFLEYVTQPLFDAFQHLFL